MFTDILCPSCVRKLRLPEEVIGREVCCPSCGHTFVAEAVKPEPVVAAPRRAAAPPPAPSLEPHRPEPEAESDDPQPRRTVRRREFRRDFDPCPACEQSVRRGAVSCPHCGLDLEEQGDGRTRLPPMRRDAEPHRGGMIRALGIFSLVCAFIYLLPIGFGLGLAAWVMGRRDLKRMREGEMDRSGRGATHNGWVCGIAGTILNGVMCAGAALILTLIIMDSSRPRPPAFAPAGGPAVPVRPWNAPAPNDFTLDAPEVVSVAVGGASNANLSVLRGQNYRGVISLQTRALPQGIKFKLQPASVGPFDPDDVTARVSADRDAVPGDYLVEITATPEVGLAKTKIIRVRVVK